MIFGTFLNFSFPHTPYRNKLQSKCQMWQIKYSFYFFIVLHIHYRYYRVKFSKMISNIFMTSTCPNTYQKPIFKKYIMQGGQEGFTYFCYAVLRGSNNDVLHNAHKQFIPLIHSYKEIHKHPYKAFPSINTYLKMDFL